MLSDTRGWILSCASGLACILGSSVIYLDVIAAKCFGKTNFRISDNRAFLSRSLSLSAGVMLFTSIYHMLPESRGYLAESGLSGSASAYISILLFLSGIVIINVFSALIHRYAPSTIVGCAHTHDVTSRLDDEQDDSQRSRARATPNETSPLLSPPPSSSASTTRRKLSITSQRPWIYCLRDFLYKCCGRRKRFCDNTGPCYGVSQACGQECARLKPNEDEDRPVRHLQAQSSASNHHIHHHDHDHDHEHSSDESLNHMHHHHDDYYDLEADRASVSSSEPGTRATHHHHVPQNPFLSLGVQTSLAISLHKLPEGFITFAANHANPRLGLSVFMSLFIHNICEGLAMALPLFLALRSRAKAMTWASILGGITQPFGAALAALWFWGSEDAYGKVTHNHDAPAAGETALMYGIIFSITAGIMTNVGMQLFAEATSLTHCHTACVKFALGGMVLLGLGQALLE